ncbi:hypothetical protein NMG60_11029310 [Bertholletia excelsa]
MTRTSTFSSCCISHEFLKAATRDPDKVAVIHAFGGAKIAKEFRSSGNNAAGADSAVNYDRFFDDVLRTAPSSHPPLYDGDRSFTYSEILAAVDSLSSRLRFILDGRDDPCLIRPTIDNFPIKQPVHVCEHNSSSSSCVEICTKDHHLYTPRVVGIYMEPSAEYVVAVLSILRCGEAFMPLDPSWPKERLSSIISSSSAALIIRCQSPSDGSGSYKPSKPQKLSDCPELFISMKGSPDQLFCPSTLAWPCQNEKSRSFCYLMYTSGSTGKPKGVCGTETGLLNRFHWMQDMYPLAGSELLLFKTAISFIDHLQEFFGALLTTCTLVIPPLSELKENLFYVYDFLQAYAISRLTAVPSLMRVMLPALQSPYNKRIQSNLKLLVLSGEVFPMFLWEMLDKLLPETTVLNLYGSTEVSGDCSYFDCKRLPSLLESETLSSVPIGMPISNCDLVLVGDDSSIQGGELYVGGLCIATGYYYEDSVTTQDFVQLPQGSASGCFVSELECQIYFRTGDFARQLQSGELIYLGRKDRTVKINGQRVALDEIESMLRGYPGVVDAAVILCRGQGDAPLLEAYLIMNQEVVYGEILRSIRRWVLEKLPLAMIPHHFFFTKSFPRTSTGKVDYSFLASLTSSLKHVDDGVGKVRSTGLLLAIKKVFCEALMVEMVSDNDDFFVMGGNSISAAHVSHKLGIDMRLLYVFPSPLGLQMALLEKESLSNMDAKTEVNLEHDESVLSFLDRKRDFYTYDPHERLLSKSDDYPAKWPKLDFDSHGNSKGISIGDGYPWDSYSIDVPCSFSRCNKVIHGADEGNTFSQTKLSFEIPRNQGVAIRELWKVHMESCVDASPLIVLKDRNIFLFIGSHSYKFLCINAKSGLIQWGTKLEGRIECSAAILGNFSQVVVGCYKGNIYFLDFDAGTILWTFQTCGEVKSQPAVDKTRHLVWCGSHDHNLYALDYRNYCCVFKVPCGGSIYGSPAIDEMGKKGSGMRSAAQAPSEVRNAFKIRLH